MFFRSLGKLSTELWIIDLFETAFQKPFTYDTGAITITLWPQIAPPESLRDHQEKEGDSEVDIMIESEDFVWSIEAKYKSDASQKTSANPERNQILRNIDVGASYSGEKDFYFSLLILSEEKSRKGVAWAREYDSAIPLDRLPN